jgi:hypothetical protein
MLQEKGLYRCKYTARSALVLIDAIFDVFIKVESLLPRVMEVTFAILEEQLVNPSTFLSADRRLSGIHRKLLTQARIHVKISLLIEILAQLLTPLVLVIHVLAY